MERIIREEIIDEIKRVARKRYEVISDSEEFRDGIALMQFHTTLDNLNYHVVEIDSDYVDSDDISGLLEAAFHDIKDRSDEMFFDEIIYQIMGAIKEEELELEQLTSGEYSPLDCGYVIPGYIDSVSCVELNEEYEN
jgi:hypothetical protein